MVVAVVGLWHLGIVTAACLASAGHKVIGFDDNAETVDDLKHVRMPIFEPGLENLVRDGIESGRLHFTSDPGNLVDADIIWVTYDTPVASNDQADVDFVIERVKAVFPHMTDGALVLISSQVPVGTTSSLCNAYRSLYPDKMVNFACSPENLRLGKAIECFIEPDRVVVGISGDIDKERILKLLVPFTNRIEWMSVESAEMTKHALNAFLATSVAFINELATLCERVGADAREVERGLKSDIRIGPRAYLRPGSAFAGGTLARDVSYLIEKGQIGNIPTHLFSGILLSNEAHKNWIQRQFTELIGDLTDKHIAVLGLTYKPGTDTLRRSTAIEICRWLSDQGASVSAHDPAIKTLPSDYARSINLCPSIEDALDGAVLALIATEWPEFKAIVANDIVSRMKQPTVLDPGRFLESNLGKDKRISYVAVGRAG